MLNMEPNSMYVIDDYLRSQSPSAHPKTKSESVAKKRPRLLVVDDEKLIADTTKDILVEAGFEVVAVYDGWSALDAAAVFHPEYLLSDVSMPGMNGVELAIAIRKIHPQTKILLFSGQAGIAGILLEGKKQGHDFELVAKPIHPLKLIEKIKSQ